MNHASHFGNGLQIHISNFFFYRKQTLGVAEYRGGSDLIQSNSVHPGTRTFSPLEAADAVREYMISFFPCADCANHFVGIYDQCEINRRCSRLTSDSTTMIEADWKELALWLWEVHNDVSVRLLKENHDSKRWRRQKVLPVTDQIKVIWPAITDCFQCLNEDGSFDEGAIFLHLEETYWFVVLSIS
jgi:Erv1 / Alr family